MKPAERGSDGHAWRLLGVVPIPPSPPISEKWFSRRRVGILTAVLLALIVVTRAGSCGPPGPAPGSVSVEQQEAFSRLNNFRGTPLVPTGELMTKAQSWSEKMANNGALSHSNLPDGIGDGWRWIGENVGVANSLANVQAALENSPDHRANMLSPKFSEAGVGVTYRNGNYWVTQDFVGR